MTANHNKLIESATPKMLKIWELLTAGKTYDEISEELKTSKSTISAVKKHFDGTVQSTSTPSKGKVQYSNSTVHIDFNINKLTKYRFIAELLGYRGTSLTIGGYKKWVLENI